MEQLYLLLFLTISMLIGSFLSGIVPMAFRLSDNKSRLLALLGSGILVGTALAIIIPEGIDSLYGQPIEKVENSVRSRQVMPPDTSKTWTIGVSLIVGFVLMLLIDQFSIFQGGGEIHIEQHTTMHHNYILANQEDEVDVIQEQLDSGGDDLETTSETKPINDIDAHKITMRTTETNNHQTGIHIHPNNRYYDHSRSASHRAVGVKVTPTLGLVIHAAADGIALGAAATTSHRQVEMIIFLAIMLHKAPAAFSLVVLLIHRGLKHSTIRRHLLAFSLSAPLATLVTYFGLSQSGKEALRKNNATGIAMLFSAGTFLYVATVHVLPDLVHNKLLKPKELFFLIGGAFLPLLLAQTI